jgi:ABC-2 type transport system ATP-binding protein
MIVAKDLTKYYGTRPAIRDLSFTIEKGEIVGFLGLNGAGKSTTLRIISCQLVPTSGTVTVAGFDVLEHSEEIRRRIGYLPEVPPLYQEMTVRSFLDFAARLKGVASRDVARRVAEVEEVTRVGEVSQQVIGTLSAGYRQRVGIAQAVVHKPELVILDEPFAGLDPVQTVDMRDMIRGLGGGHTVLLSSHQLSQIHQTCDRILVIQDGRIAAQGTEDELAARAGAREEVAVEVRGAADDVVAALRTVEGPASVKIERDHDGVVDAVVAVPAGIERWSRTRAGGAVEHEDVVEALAAAVVEAGLGLRGLRRSEAELESVFVQLTRGEGPEEPKAEAGAEAERSDEDEKPAEAS